MTTKKPKSGYWTPLDTAFINGALTPVRRGERYPWDHPAVQASPNLFVSADLSPGDLTNAVAAFRASSLDESAALASAMDGETSSGVRVQIPRVLEPGRGVVRCVKLLSSALPNPYSVGPSMLRVRPGDLARADAWFVRKWPRHFEPSVG